jgi:ferric-dicitrate binding protein FerR (iron transport regulator)
MNRRDQEMLIQELFEGRLEGEAMEDLQRELRTNPEARDAYRDYVHLHNALQLRAEGIDLLSIVPIERVDERRKRRHLRHTLLAAAAGVALLAAVVSLVHSRVTPPTLTFLASDESEFSTSHLAAGKDAPAGQVLIPGSRLDVRRGTVELEFRSGIRGIVRAPADLTVQSEDQLYLAQGTAWFNVPPKAVGFKVSMSDLIVTDLGTEFGIQSKPDSPSEVHVFTGKVETGSRNGLTAKEIVTAGQARKVGPAGGLLEIPLRTKPFLTRLPVKGSALDMTVTPDETAMTVTGARYTARLALPQGTLLSLRDRAAGQDINLGDSGGHLWVAHFAGQRDVSSGDYAPADVTWSWDAVKQTLTILYPANQARLPAVRAEWQFSNRAWLDLSLTVDNQTGHLLLGVQNDLRLPATTLESAILPVLPGIQLQRKFFTDRRTWRQGQYPRAPVFADYAHFRAGRATLTTFPILNRDLTQVARHKLFPDGDAYVWRHNFELAEASGTTWTSPRLRLRVGDGEADGARAFWNDTGLGLAPSLRQKLGARYDRVVSSLSTKMDARVMLSDFGLTLADQAGYSRIWQGLPGPAMLFIKGGSGGGFFENNPDIFPVDPRLGSDDQWKQVFQSANAAGHLNIPYINPTFWKANSETVKSMDPKEFAAYKNDGTPQIFNYGTVTIPHTGYVTCPYAPATRKRIARTFKELSEKMPVDFVWEDQVGSRYVANYSPNSPNPMWTAQGWLAHTRTYAKLGLMTDFGHDRMVETHVGFQGNYLLAEQQHWGDVGPEYWGEDTWRIWPVVPMMARDKVMFYNAPDNECVSKPVLTWSLAMGQMLSWNLKGSHFRSPWHFTADAFQRHVMARYADQPLIDFAVLPDHITRSRFGDYTVWANESPDQDWQAPDGPRLAAGGCWVTERHGLLSAGIFTAFNGQPLTAGDHYLIVETRADGITVRHPQGPDTPLTLKTAKPVKSVKARFDRGNSEVPFRIENGQVFLEIKGKLLEQDVRSYELSY